jgi:hypothetical protein
MPFVTDNKKIGLKVLKRTAKLLDCQREMVKYWHKEGLSINGIARMFHVNKRLIQFILFPERHKRNLQLRKERGGSTIYYKKENHTDSVRKHRRYKYNLLTGKAKNDPPMSSSIAEQKYHNKQIYQKESQKENHNKSNRKAIVELRKHYIINQIQQSTGLSREEIKKHPELIESMKQQIKLKRLLKQKKYGNK